MPLNYEPDAARETEHEPAVPESESIEHTFQLRPDNQISLTLPANLTANEAARLSAFIKTLPFDSPAA